MAWSTEQLEVLEKAIAEGVTRLKYENKEVEYRSLEDMMKLRDIIRAELGIVDKSGQRLYASYSKGFK